MKHYILYSHDGSGNHGCEALVRTTIELLQDSDTSFTLSSSHPEEDLAYGIDKLCDVVKIHSKSKSVKKDIKFLKAYYQLKVKHNYLPLDQLAELATFNAQKGDIALSIGGDSYCYGGTDKLAFQNRIWKYGGLKTVYWGCSIEPELLNNKEIAADIASFDLITARETISFNALKEVNSNTILVNDSAFLLNKIIKPLPMGIKQDVVGINLSPMVTSREISPGIVKKNYEGLIEFILKETDMSVLLIPHVIWESNDDRILNDCFFQRYNYTGRVFKVEDARCEELKGYISQCRFFVGARTHATIAAYSSLVPTLVLGYSVKSRGIARDLFGDEENYVIPVQGLKSTDTLVKSFMWIYKHEESIKKHLVSIMPDYSKRVYKAREIIKNLRDEG